MKPCGYLMERGPCPYVGLWDGRCYVHSAEKLAVGFNLLPPVYEDGNAEAASFYPPRGMVGADNPYGRGRMPRPEDAVDRMSNEAANRQADLIRQRREAALKRVHFTWHVEKGKVNADCIHCHPEKETTDDLPQEPDLPPLDAEWSDDTRDREAEAIGAR